MDERDDYAELVPPPPIADPRWLHYVGRNLLVAVGLIVVALSAAGLLMIQVAEMRRIRLPEIPAPDTSFLSTVPLFGLIRPRPPCSYGTGRGAVEPAHSLAFRGQAASSCYRYGQAFPA
ncbi:MAG: hypothetical protein J2P46_19285 [Zavarzinella sp.]|nr:hypothetical protein [Zavarzinella sp.]